VVEKYQPFFPSGGQTVLLQRRSLKQSTTAHAWIASLCSQRRCHYFLFIGKYGGVDASAPLVTASDEGGNRPAACFGFHTKKNRTEAKLIG
jgi:hypothetical protein